MTTFTHMRPMLNLQHPILQTMLIEPIASSSRLPALPCSSRPIPSSRLMSTTHTPSISRPYHIRSEKRIKIVHSHQAYSSHLHNRGTSSISQPTPTLSTPSIPFPSSSLSSSPSRSTISHHGLNITAPSLQAIQEEGYLDDDIQLIPTDDAWINVTPEAIKQLVTITSREPPDLLAQGKLALRVGVESGGCHGYQYTMAITEERGVDDYVMQPEGVESIPVVIDLVSLGLLKGATLHHATELIGSSFRLQDNPQAKEGGACGCGVSWEAKI